MVELIWDSKYDARGKRTAPVLETLLQTVNQSTQQYELTGDLTRFRNLLADARTHHDPRNPRSQNPP